MDYPRPNSSMSLRNVLMGFYSTIGACDLQEVRKNLQHNRQQLPTVTNAVHRGG